MDVGVARQTKKPRYMRGFLVSPDQTGDLTMPRNETILNVFIASPSDVTEERRTLESIIQELNKTWSQNLNLRFDLIKWETDTYPSFADYPQNAINNQIDDNYDIFIAIFWSKTGTPTEKADSGTIEEFDRAYQKHLKDNSAVEIMIYFKDQPISPSKLNIEQLGKLQHLKKSLGEKGGLYWTFEDSKEFETSLRVHLSKVAQKWAKKIGSENPPKDRNESSEKQQPLEIFDEDDDYGILDYFEIFEDKMSVMTSGLCSIAEATDKVGSQFTTRTHEINSLTASGEKIDPSRARRILKLSADDLDRFSETVELQVTIVSNSREDAFEALSKAVALQVNIASNTESESAELKDAISSMRNSAIESQQGLINFRSTIESFPKLTIYLNKSKRKALKALDGIFEEIDTTIRSTDEILSLIR